MIQELKIKNFCSFRDEVCLNFEATRDTFAENSQVVKINDSTRLLRYGIIYGYNASGKSNILKAFDFLDNFWSYTPKDMDKPTGVSPFRLNNTSPDEPTRFELTFFVEDTKYSYTLVLDSHQVYLEKLSYYHSIQPIMLFERTLEEGQSIIQFNSTNPHTDRISNFIKEEISVKCLKNMSFFAARNQVNARIPLIDAAKDWLRNKIMPTIYPATSLTSYAQRQTNEDDAAIRHILSFLKEADFNISGISTNVITKPISDMALNMLIEDYQIPENEKDRMKKEKTIKQLRTEFQHTVRSDDGIDESYLFLGKDESLGTLRVFGLEAALFEVMRNKGFLPIDEIETSLHPKLVEKILFEYLRVPTRSQILISTHEDGLLDLTDDLIRKDAIWFTDKGANGVTEVYKLSDFRGINRLSSIREAYRNKRFGASMK